MLTTATINILISRKKEIKSYTQDKKLSDQIYGQLIHAYDRFNPFTP